MLKKILSGLGILVLLAAVAGAIFYWQFQKENRPPVSDQDRARLTVMPLPAMARINGEDIAFPARVSVRWEGHTDERLRRALDRFVKTAGVIDATDADFQFIITCDSATAEIPRVRENESYHLSISRNRFELKAVTPFGIMRGMETILQLRQKSGEGYTLPSIIIKDKPRYPWRGIMIDVCRHFITKETLLRNIDLMAAVKLNVLHLHLTEYQAFRIESRVFPKLHELGSGGKYLSQDDVREIVRYASDRGIRVVPEFDIPGHATSWFVGHPELATKAGPYVPDTRIGILTPIMDPTKELVYEFLDQFFGEMAALFPDEYVHIGGDEVSTVDWQESETVTQFMKANNIADYHALQAYFNKRVKAILEKHGKKMIGWDEILNPELGSDVMVQSWRSHKSLFESVQKGNGAILSAGYYLDHKLPAGKHYSVDPEAMEGAVTIKPDSVNWKVYDLTLRVSDNPMQVTMVLYGRREDNNLRGVFKLLDNSTGFENASFEGEELVFTFQAEVGEIDVRAKFNRDSVSGTMGLGFLSFPFSGAKVAGNDIAGTTPPRIEQVKPLTAEDKTRILGGEAAMWSEVVSDVNIDSRLWPRSAAIAEKFWSPQVLTKNEDDMYRRLKVVSEYLEAKGSRHISGPRSIITSIASENNLDELNILTECLEEAKYYDRLAADPEMSVLTPLNNFVDGLQPESFAAYDLQVLARKFLEDPKAKESATALRQAFERYRDNATRFNQQAIGNATREQITPHSADVKEVCDLALTGIESLTSGTPLSAAEKKSALQRLDDLQKPRKGIVIAISEATRIIVEKL